MGNYFSYLSDLHAVLEKLYVTTGLKVCHAGCWDSDNLQPVHGKAYYIGMLLSLSRAAKSPVLPKLELCLNYNARYLSSTTPFLIACEWKMISMVDSCLIKHMEKAGSRGGWAGNTGTDTTGMWSGCQKSLVLCCIWALSMLYMSFMQCIVAITCLERWVSDFGIWFYGTPCL